jgi:hypothetical protein
MSLFRRHAADMWAETRSIEEEEELEDENRYSTPLA